MKAKTKLIARITLLVGLCLPIASLAGDMLHMNPQSIEQKGNVSINILGDWRVSIIEIDGAFTRIPEFAETVYMQINSNQISGVAGCNSFMSPLKMLSCDY